jgi:outer membrane autotransporter protein
MDGGIVDISNTEGNITITNLEGDGGDVVMDASKSNTFKVANDTDTVVTAVASANADSVTEAQAKKMVERLGGVTNKSAMVEEGDVNGALTVDASGNAKQAKNTLMDAALKQASVTTVALDKILTNDVRKRLGDIRSDKNTTGVWMRWDGGKLQGNGLSNDFNTIQIGGDTKVGKNCRLGVAGTFTHGDAEFARGTAELEGFTFATYATWMGENGMFADVVARLGQFSNEMKVEGRTGDMDNRVFSLSGEYGWRLPVCDQFFVEPQVELAYTYVSSDDLELGTAKYAFDSVNSLTGRAGVVFGWNLPDDRGNVYARASVLQQFMGDAKITGFTGTGLSSVQEIDGDDTWIEYGIGANVKLTEKTYIWADVERTEGAELDEEWRGTVGIRYSF